MRESVHLQLGQLMCVRPSDGRPESCIVLTACGRQKDSGLCTSAADDVSCPVCRTVPFIFSIRPRHVASLVARTKLVEYRTRRPSLKHGDVILIYETAPTSKVVAAASVRGLIAGSPAEVWAQTSDRGGIEQAEFDAYFAGRPLAVAIDLSAIVRLPASLALPAGQHPPQAWARWSGAWPPRLECAAA